VPACSIHPKVRGCEQIVPVAAGNHFVEMDRVDVRNKTGSGCVDILNHSLEAAMSGRSFLFVLALV